MREVGVGVIGGGWFGEIHMHTLSKLPNAKLVAVCSRREEHAKELASKYGAKKWYTDMYQLVRDKEIEAVHVVTAEPEHREPTVAAAENGKHVLVEKPIATTLKDADAMIAAAKKANVFFMVAEELRFDPRYVMAKEEIDKGKVGKILSIYARRNVHSKRSIPYLKRVSSIVDDSWHDTDLMLWYTKDKVTEVYADAINMKGTENPDLGWVMYKFSKGTIGVSEAAWILPDTSPYGIDAKMEILGTEGAIYLDFAEQGIIVNDKEGWRAPDTYHWPLVHGERMGDIKEEISYFINCVMKGQKPVIVPPEESRVTLEAVLAADQSAKTRKLIKLPLK
jgi:UDP-N-acetylglucosamine 3-dehydrogenase